MLVEAVVEGPGAREARKSGQVGANLAKASILCKGVEVTECHGTKGDKE